MKIIDQSWHWMQNPNQIYNPHPLPACNPNITPLQLIELAGRTCYKSEDKITDDSAAKFVAMLLRRGHESVIEHVSASVKFITNRGVTHELVRHRLASFSQMSTRYVRYDGDMEFIRPVWWGDWSADERIYWITSLEYAEHSYKGLLEFGSRPEQAREVLPNSLATEIIMTANLREWRHVFKLRCSPKAHQQTRELMRDCLQGFKDEIPVVFDDIGDDWMAKNEK
jgi:thymidylate synthase (FAD)